MKADPLFCQDNQLQILKELVTLYVAADNERHRDKVFEMIINVIYPPYVFKGE